MESGGPLDLGILLVGHGTRDPQGLAEFHATVQQVAERLPSLAVEPAFLELASPTISDGYERLVERSKQKIVVTPLLLFAAGHAKQDIPAAINTVAQKHPGVAWSQAESLGCHVSLVELSALRFQEALAASNLKRKHVQLIVVGRGSHDPEATMEMTRYAKLLGERVGIGRAVIGDVQTSFLAMAKPPLSDVLAEAAQSESDTIVVQPHLLFHGELLEEVQQRVQDWRARVASKQWLVTGHLGPTAQVVAAVLDRCRQAEASLSSL